MFYDRPAGIYWVDRGDTATPDLETGDFVADSAWHDLNLSGIVPSNAILMYCRLILNSVNLGDRLLLRKKGYTSEYNMSDIRIVVPNIYTIAYPIISLNENGIAEYKRLNPEFNFIEMTVRGWWI